MHPITTHVLNTSSGLPASGINVTLEIQNDDSWNLISRSQTNDDGRIMTWPESYELQNAVYRIKFFTKEYFEAKKEETFYPYVEIVFEINSARQHFHVPLLISNFGYSTYRGS